MSKLTKPQKIALKTLAELPAEATVVTAPSISEYGKPVPSRKLTHTGINSTVLFNLRNKGLIKCGLLFKGGVVEDLQIVENRK